MAAASAEAQSAQARAEQARARAAELRSQLQNTEPPAPRTRRQVPWQAIGIGVTAAAIAGLLTLSGSWLWQHHRASTERQQRAEFAAAARQGVINLMSIDYASAKDSVQRVLDSSTGKFRDNFIESSDDFVTAMQNEKITTKATVNDAAVESISGDTATVLVSATSMREGAQAPKDQQQPRVWRVVVTMELDGGQPKMSGVEFV